MRFFEPSCSIIVKNRRTACFLFTKFFRQGMVCLMTRVLFFCVILQSIILFSFFVTGLIIGSFLNVVVYRLKGGETLLGRSFCRSCRHQIRWYDNIPLLSFLWLYGKCRDCQATISWQYPLLELITGVFFLLAGHYFFSPLDQGTWLETGWLLGVISLMVTIAFYDLRTMEIPIVLLIAAAVWTGLYLSVTLYLAVQSFETIDGLFLLTSHFGQGMIGGMVVGAFFFALVFASKETWMGWGDVWLGAVSGMVVGFSAVLFMLTLSFGVGALVGITAIVLKKKGLKSQIPFAPYLVLGTLLTLFLPFMFPQVMSFLIP